MKSNNSIFRYRAGFDEENFFDLLVATCGYEARAREVATKLEQRCARVTAYTYPSNHTLSYQTNHDYFSTIGEVLNPLTTADFARILHDNLLALCSAGNVPRVAIDISSFDRDRLGAIIRTIDSVGGDHKLTAHFFYAVGSFDSLDEARESMVLVNSPLEGFEGWTSSPSLPVACVIGLGFEDLIALAALETLEPAKTIAFLAQSEDSRFRERVIRDNAPLIRSEEVLVASYDLDNPFDSLHALESVVHALRRTHRVALVPLGPKLFALIALLVAREYPNEVAVWRVSADQGGHVQDRTATGQILELRVDVVGSHSPTR